MSKIYVKIITYLEESIHTILFLMFQYLLYTRLIYPINNSFVFSRCFPSLAKKNKAVLNELRENIIFAIRGTVLPDLCEVVDEDVKDSLNKLNQLIKQDTNPKNIVAWRPTGNPEEDAKSHDAKVRFIV